MMPKPSGGWTSLLVATALCVGSEAIAAPPPTFAGLAFGTNYRVMLAEAIPHRANGDIHREIEQILRTIDLAASTWRHDSDAARVNRSPVGEWVAVEEDLLAILRVAREVHDASGGAFDPTVAPLLVLLSEHHPYPPDPMLVEVALSLVGLDQLEWCDADHADDTARGGFVRRLRDGVAIDLGGIGPGYAVDRIGARLVSLGSRGHLVSLGGEVRAWGRRQDGSAWRVAVGEGRSVTLADGEAIATSTSRRGRSPVDPRSGAVVDGPSSVRVRACTCAEADAWAVAALVLRLETGPDGVVDRRVFDRGPGGTDQEYPRPSPGE